MKREFPTVSFYGVGRPLSPSHAAIRRIPGNGAGYRATGLKRPTVFDGHFVLQTEIRPPESLASVRPETENESVRMPALLTVLGSDRKCLRTARMVNFDPNLFESACRLFPYASYLLTIRRRRRVYKAKFYGKKPISR